MFQTAQQRLRAMVAQALAASNINSVAPSRYPPVNGGSNLTSAQTTAVTAEEDWLEKSLEYWEKEKKMSNFGL